MTCDDYLQKIIIDLVNGSPHFYTIIEKERFRRFLTNISEVFQDAPSDRNEMIERLSSSETVDELLMWSGLGNKTLTNISGGKTLSLDDKKEICIDVLNELAMFYDNPDTENPDVKFIAGQEMYSSEMSAFLLVVLSSAYASVSGSIRSEYGKSIEGCYLTYLFESMNIHETEDVDSLETYADGIFYTMGKRGECDKGALSIVEQGGREIDALVFTRNPKSNELVFILAIEFTVGGRGNPSAAVNKAKSLSTSFRNCFGNGLVFFAYDLGSLRRDIDRVVTQIYFKDHVGTEPLEIVYDLIESRLQELGCDFVKLVEKDKACENFLETIEELE